LNSRHVATHTVTVHPPADSQASLLDNSASEGT
jgi:hypothetical protein